MAADFVKGYESSTPESANAPNRPSQDAYREPGHLAKAVKARWKDAPEAYPHDKNDDGGGGGGDG